MRRFFVMIALSAVLAFCGTAWSASSLSGPTGLVVTPTAEVVGMASFDVGVTGIAADETEDVTIIYANFGLLPDLELSAARMDFEDSATETLVNAKLRLLGPLPGKISVAVGMNDISDQVDRSGYVVASHTLGAGLLTEFGQVTTPQIHVGIGQGMLDGVFGGISTTFARKIGLAAEYDGDDVNLAARFALAPRIEATVAALSGAEDFAFGVSLRSPW